MRLAPLWLLALALTSVACAEADPASPPPSDQTDDTDTDSDTDTDPLDEEDPDTDLSDEPTYAGAVQPILQKYCAACHTGGCNDCFVTRYDVLLNPATFFGCNGLTLGECALVRVENGSMPPNSGCTPGDDRCITDDELAMLEEWVDLGMPE